MQISGSYSRLDDHPKRFSSMRLSEVFLAYATIVYATILSHSRLCSHRKVFSSMRSSDHILNNSIIGRNSPLCLHRITFLRIWSTKRFLVYVIIGTYSLLCNHRKEFLSIRSTDHIVLYVIIGRVSHVFSHRKHILAFEIIGRIYRLRNHRIPLLPLWPLEALLALAVIGNIFSTLKSLEEFMVYAIIGSHSCLFDHWKRCSRLQSSDTYSRLWNHWKGFWSTQSSDPSLASTTIGSVARDCSHRKHILDFEIIGRIYGLRNHRITLLPLRPLEALLALAVIGNIFSTLKSLEGFIVYAIIGSHSCLYDHWKRCSRLQSSETYSRLWNHWKGFWSTQSSDPSLASTTIGSVARACSHRKHILDFEIIGRVSGLRNLWIPLLPLRPLEAFLSDLNIGKHYRQCDHQIKFLLMWSSQHFFVYEIINRNFSQCDHRIVLSSMWSSKGFSSMRSLKHSLFYTKIGRFSTLCDIRNRLWLLELSYRILTYVSTGIVSWSCYHYITFLHMWQSE